MPHKIRMDGVVGRVAIYESTDNLPWSTPLSYLSRTLFHSGLAYPNRVSTVTGSVNFPLRNGGLPISCSIAQHTLFAHGLGYIPFVEGRWIGVGDGGVDVPAVGSIPVQSEADARGFAACNRWLTLCWDTTNVYIHEMWSRFSGSSIAARTISYEVHVMGISL